jgi:2-keto-3-deoxy-L-rhamnonate aldolase RhmA
MSAELPRTTRYRQAGEEGRCAIGVTCALDGYATSQLFATLGMDFVFIDRQHAAYSWPELESMVWRLYHTGTAIWVRLAGSSFEELNLTLDLPVDGIVVPNIESLDDAKRVLDESLLPPLGHRSVGNVRNGRLMGHDFRSIPVNPEICLMVEHIDAADAIEEIVKLDGLGAIFLGPHDLAGSMGIDTNTEAYSPPEFLEVVQRVKDVSQRNGIAYWSWAGTLEHLKDYIDTGVDAVIYKADGMILQEAIEGFFAEIADFRDTPIR